MIKLSLEDAEDYRRRYADEDSYLKLAEETGITKFIERVPRNVGFSFYKALGVSSIYHAFGATMANSNYFGSSVAEVTSELVKLLFSQYMYINEQSYTRGINRRSFILS